MSASTQSPILDFLMSKENLPAALEVIRYAKEIRESVQRQFWERLEHDVKKHQPSGLNLNLSWQQNFASKPADEFGLEARITPVNEKVQALSYRIASGPDYFGLGLWLKLRTEEGYDNFCKIREVKILQAYLQKKRSGQMEPPWWLWWERWQRGVYAADDPWSWFAKDRDEAWHKDTAAKFWSFVGETHNLVLEANKAVKKSK